MAFLLANDLILWRKSLHSSGVCMNSHDAESSKCLETQSGERRMGWKGSARPLMLQEKQDFQGLEQSFSLYLGKSSGPVTSKAFGIKPAAATSTIKI